MSTDLVLKEKRGSLGLITLNRPKPVNALNTEMIHDFSAALMDLENDADVAAVAVIGAGERGFCAGGDVVGIYRATQGEPDIALDFFRAEYALDYQITQYSKPYVPLMNGLVLGGGVGISAPGSHRVVTDSTKLGMPETGIGFSPDVAGTNYLAQAPGQLGRFLALTGHHMAAADAIAVGLADEYVSDGSVLPLLADLETVTDPEDVERTIRRFISDVPASELETARSWIDRAFAAEGVEEILDNVEAVVEKDPENTLAANTLAALRRNSPTGLKVALEALNRAGGQSIAETLHQDFRLCGNAIFAHDMGEGIRAQIIDKDRNPQWKPATLEEVTTDVVARFFDPIPGHEDLDLNLTANTSRTANNTRRTP